MGVSSDGILVFGFPVGGEYEPPEWLQDEDGNEVDFDDFVLFDTPLGEYDDYAKKAALIKKCPAELVLHCSYDYPMHILAVRGTAITAYRGYPKVIDPEIFAVPEDKIAALREWCESQGIEFQEPKWRLCSMYG